MKAPVTPPTERHTLDRERIRYDMREPTGAKYSQGMVPVPDQKSERQAEGPACDVVGNGAMPDTPPRKLQHPF
jgi:hypothetical protein